MASLIALKRANKSVFALRPSITLPCTSLVASSSGSCCKYPTFIVDAVHIAPSTSLWCRVCNQATHSEALPLPRCTHVSVLARMRNRLLLPLPFSPTTPILAPRKNDRLTSLKSTRPPGRILVVSLTVITTSPWVPPPPAAIGAEQCRNLIRLNEGFAFEKTASGVCLHDCTRKASSLAALQACHILSNTATLCGIDAPLEQPGKIHKRCAHSNAIDFVVWLAVNAPLTRLN